MNFGIGRQKQPRLSVFGCGVSVCGKKGTSSGTCSSCYSLLVTGSSMALHLVHSRCQVSFDAVQQKNSSPLKQLFTRTFNYGIGVEVIQACLGLASLTTKLCTPS